MEKKITLKKTKQSILNTIIEEGNYNELKKTLLRETTEYILIKELALNYIENILQLSLYAKQTKEDLFFFSNKDINELVFEYYVEISALKECLIECINILNSNNTIGDCIVRINKRIEHCKEDLYPGFLCSYEDIQEVSILYMTLKEFRQQIITNAN